MKTSRGQSGFTLIELVVVIIILGVLAAVAVPKFIDMSIDAHNSAAKGVAGALASGASTNFAAKSAGTATAATINAASVCTAAILSTFLSGTSTTLVDSVAAVTDDQTFAVGGTGDCSGSNTSVVCTVTPRGTGVSAANASILCAR